MIFDASQIAAATNGVLLRDGPGGPILTDSRRLQSGAWFVALSGENFDGHDFLPHAMAAGCAGALVSDAARLPAGWAAGVVVVPDTLVGLQDLGRAARARFSGPVVGITGSAGKTTTRVMVSEVLKAGVDRRVHHTEGNLNNHIGVPLTLCATPPDADLMVVELGMNHRGEIALLQEIALPEVRVITNVGAAHVEGCGSLAGVALAKQELFDGARPGDVCIVNDDDPLIATMPVPAGVRVVRFGLAEHCQIRLTDVRVDPERLRTRMRIETPDGIVRAVLEVPGAHLAECAMAAVAVGFVLRVPVDTMAYSLARFRPEGMRNRIERVHGVVVLDDAYNANPISMAAALRTLAALPHGRVAALGDMLELGISEAESHLDVLRLGLALGLTLRVTGERMVRAAEQLGSGAGDLRAYADVDALAGSLDAATLCRGDALLIKGSRGSRMERVLDHWRRNGAPGPEREASNPDDALTEDVPLAAVHRKVQESPR